MNIIDAIRARRSIKQFTDKPVPSKVLMRLLEAATLAPNHRMTQPWRFYVLGPEARREYGRVLGGRKAKRIEDPTAANEVIARVAASHQQLPAMIAVAIEQNENPEIREEDYAAAMMAVQNLSLAALAEGLGTHIKTGAVMDDPGARSAVGVPDDQRIVSIVNIGEPAAVPLPKPRTEVEALTTRVD